MNKIAKHRNQPITDENMSGGWPIHPRRVEIASDSVIGVEINAISALSNMGEQRLAKMFTEQPMQRAKDEQFIRSVGRAANLSQLESEANIALGQTEQANDQNDSTADTF